MNALNDASRGQLSQQYDGQELPVAFLSQTFTDTQQKWSTTAQEASGIFYVVTKWNYYLQGSDMIVYNENKPLQKFLNGKNANNKVNRSSLELATYNTRFEWISGANNKAADCLSQLVDVKDIQATPTALINMLVTFTLDGLATCTHSKTHNTANITPADLMSTSTNDKVNAPLSFTEDQMDTLRLMEAHANIFPRYYSVAKHPNMR